MDRPEHVYRAYHIGSTGRFMRSEILAAPNDHEAMRQVGAMSNSYGIELWDRGRPVAKAEPRPHGRSTSSGALSSGR